MVGSGMFNGIAKMLIVGVISVVLCVFFILYTVFDLVFIEETIKSDKLIVPEIRLQINNNKVDTVYIYRNK